MSTKLDLNDVQGSVVKAYASYGLVVARYLFFHVDVPVAGRKFVGDILPLITTGVSWLDASKIPQVATNIAFTYRGLRHLDTPEATLHGFPEAFAMGMKARRSIIGDTGQNYYRGWDPVWNIGDDNKQQNDKQQYVHIIVTIDGKKPEDLEIRYEQIQQILAASPGVTQLTGHRGDGSLRSAVSAGGRATSS